MASTPQSSALQDYMQNYGSRLQSMLHSPVESSPVTDTLSALGRVPATSGAGPIASPTSALEAEPTRAAASPARLAHEQSELEQGSSQGKSFADYWREMPQAEQKSQVDTLEQTLARGNESIDTAYDGMISQLGVRPGGKLSREDKGMLLMEFGLSLMSASARGAHGDDLGGAIGAAGSRTLGRYQQMTSGRQGAYDSQVGAINAARAKSKSALAEKGAVEHIKGASALQRDRQRDESEAARLTGTVTTEDGEVYGYTRGGQASALLDETGQPLRTRERAASTGGRGFEAEWRYNQYMQVHGVDEQGRPLAGEALRQVEAEALKYAQSRGGDSRTANQKNIEDMIARGIPEDLAVKIVYRQIRDPRQAWQQIYTAGIKGYRTREEAIAEADDIIERIYGHGSMARTRQPLIPSDGDEIARPRTQAEFEQLPSGAAFIAPDGSLRRKP